MQKPNFISISRLVQFCPLHVIFNRRRLVVIGRRRETGQRIGEGVRHERRRQRIIESVRRRVFPRRAAARNKRFRSVATLGLCAHALKEGIRRDDGSSCRSASRRLRKRGDSKNRGKFDFDSLLTSLSKALFRFRNLNFSSQVKKR